METFWNKATVTVSNIMAGTHLYGFMRLEYPKSGEPKQTLFAELGVLEKLRGKQPPSVALKSQNLRLASVVSSNAKRKTVKLRLDGSGETVALRIGDPAKVNRAEKCPIVSLAKTEVALIGADISGNRISPELVLGGPFDGEDADDAMPGKFGTQDGKVMFFSLAGKMYELVPPEAGWSVKKQVTVSGLPAVVNTIHAGKSLSCNTLSPDWGEQNRIPHWNHEKWVGFNPPIHRKVLRFHCD